MLKNKIIRSYIPALLFGVVLISCERSTDMTIQENMDLSGKAIVKIHNSVVNSSRNIAFVDNVPVTGAAGIMYYVPASGPVSFPNTVYGFAVNAGSRSILIRDSSSTSTQIPTTVTGNFEAGKNYTIFTYDSITRVKSKLVETSIIIPDNDTTARLRFANMITFPTATPNIDIYSARLKANIFSNVPVGSVTDYTLVRSLVADTFYVRVTGTTTNITLNGTSGPTQIIGLSPVFTSKRSYTLIFRGLYGSTATPTGRELRIFTDY
jgi:hypothetical protein